MKIITNNNKAIIIKHANLIITVKISTCIIIGRTIKEGTLNKDFLQVDQAD